ncbi:hypothetical protein C0989_002353 [Termitomyces sp. Mn162]|nr:hypothetical protein C0989_002353 [Termitomyces sp. Mn162]
MKETPSAERQTMLSFRILTLAVPALALAPAGPWDSFNFAPISKTVYPAAIHSISSQGMVTNTQLLVSNSGSATLSGKGAWVALDYGVEVGGLISFNILNTSHSTSLSLSFTESPSFIRPTASDDSSFPDASTTYDGVLRVPAPLAPGFWIQPVSALRGGFRFLTIVLNADGDKEVTIANVSCAISFMPHVDDLRAYSGYFYATDPVFSDPSFLTKVWYAGAYTVQTNTVALNTGREVPFAPRGSWANNATLGIAGPIIVDGAKRDRAVWPGDMGIAVPTQFVSTNDLLPTRNALSTMFAAINPITGALPESGPPLNQMGSDTYHMWTLIGTCDTPWLESVWANYTKAVAFLENKVNTTTGLIDITGLRDWARLGGGGYNAEGNAIYYKVLTTATSLATSLSHPNLSLATHWSTAASTLKTAFNAEFYLPSRGMYRDNTSTTLCPQDANSFAVLFNLTTSEEMAGRVSEGLEGNWGEVGPVAPELPGTVSPFISGFELQAHFESGNDARALELLRRTWGYMLYTNLSVQSTLLEGYTANGSLSYRSTDGYNHDPAYTSHSHGWSSGPTSALTFYVLGLQITAPQGTTWALAPHLSGLEHAEGGFETGLGWFGVKWSIGDGSGSLEVQVTTPEKTSGVFRIPSGFDGSLEVGGVDFGDVESGQEVDVPGGSVVIVLRPS